MYNSINLFSLLLFLTILNSIKSSNDGVVGGESGHRDGEYLNEKEVFTKIHAVKNSPEPEITGKTLALLKLFLNKLCTSELNKRLIGEAIEKLGNTTPKKQQLLAGPAHKVFSVLCQPQTVENPLEELQRQFQSVEDLGVENDEQFLEAVVDFVNAHSNGKESIDFDDLKNEALKEVYKISFF